MSKIKKVSLSATTVDRPKAGSLVRTRRANPALAKPLKPGVSFADTEKPLDAPKVDYPPESDVSETLPFVPSKQDAVIFLLRRKRGATLDDMTAITGWLTHSVRGLMSGVLKKKLGLNVVSEPDPQRGRVYRIPAEPLADQV